MQIREESNRFALYNDENQEIGEMTRLNASEGMMITDHMLIGPAYRGQRLVERLVLTGVKKARRKHKKTILLYPFAKKELDAKPEYGDVLGE